jgi:hypothetical protein
LIGVPFMRPYLASVVEDARALARGVDQAE